MEIAKDFMNFITASAETSEVKITGDKASGFSNYLFNVGASSNKLDIGSNKQAVNIFASKSKTDNTSKETYTRAEKAPVKSRRSENEAQKNSAVKKDDKDDNVDNDKAKTGSVAENTAIAAEVTDENMAILANDEQTVEVKLDNSSEENQAIIANLAVELEVPKEVVEDILNQLGITAEQLTQPENMTKFLQVFTNSESPVQLLSVENLKELITKIESSIKNAQDGIQLTAETAVIDEALVETAAATEVRPANEEMQKYMASVEKRQEKRQAAMDSSARTADVESTDNGGVQLEEVNVLQAEGEETDLFSMFDDTSDTEEDTQFLNQSSNQPKETIIDEANAEEADTVQQKVEVVDIKVDANGNTQTTVRTETNVVSAAAGTAEQSTITTQTVTSKQTPVMARDAAAIINQLAERVTLTVRADTTEMRMILKPESLGSVALKITTENGIVSAQFMAESQRVKEVIESNLSTLKESLKSQGINVSEMSVEVGSDDADQRMERFLYEQRRSSARVRQILGNLDSEGSEESDENNVKMVTREEVMGNTVNYSV